MTIFRLFKIWRKERESVSHLLNIKFKCKKYNNSNIEYYSTFIKHSIETFLEEKCDDLSFALSFIFLGSSSQNSMGKTEPVVTRRHKSLKIENCTELIAFLHISGLLAFWCKKKNWQYLNAKFL